MPHKNETENTYPSVYYCRLILLVIIVSLCMLSCTSVNKLTDYSKYKKRDEVSCIIDKSRFYHKKVSTYLIRGKNIAGLTPITGTCFIPIYCDESGNKYYQFPAAQFLFDSLFERFFYNKRNKFKKKRKWIVIVKNLSINLTKKNITYELEAIYIGWKGSSFMHKSSIKLQNVIDLPTEDYQLLSYNFNELYNVIKLDLESDINMMLNNDFSKFFKKVI